MVRSLAVAPSAQQPADDEQDFPGTFSILGYDQSKHHVVVPPDAAVFLDDQLQVDDNPGPLKELRRLVEMNARRFQRK